MPEHPNPKEREHPWQHLKGSAPSSTSSLAGGRHFVSPSLSSADLHVTTNFTFLTGASHPEELIQRAASLGHAAAAITDINSLAGVVRAHVAAKEVGIPLAVGTRVDLENGKAAQRQSGKPGEEGQAASPSDLPLCRFAALPLSLLLFPTSRPAYANLCRLLTTGKRRAPKGQCFLSLSDVVEHSEGMLAVLLPPAALDDGFLQVAQHLRDVFAKDDRLSLAACRRFGPDDESSLRALADLSDHTRIPLVATSDIHYHTPGRRALQDVLTCIRHRCTIDQAGLRLLPHAEHHLKPPDEMARLFAGHERAIARSAQVALRAARGFNLDQLRYEYPDEVIPPNTTAMQHLTELTWQCARTRYPAGVPPKVSSQILHELRLIDELAYAHYFLTVHDLVVHARSLGILCQGRGAAANSAVCYCLGVTSVDPDRIDMLFERFLSKERNEPPDIDIDFEHERREEVIQYIYAKYGRDRAALTAEVITYRGRSAIRDVGKALGLSLDCVDTMAKSLDWWERVAGITREQRADGKPEKRTTAFAKRLLELGLSPDDPTLEKVLDLVGQLVGFPRHLSQHVGGFVMTKGPLCESVPIENAAMENRTVIEWDKDDIDALGMLKVDVLGLGMLTCIRRAFDFVNGGLAPRSEGATERSHGWSDAALSVAEPVETESNSCFRPGGADEGQRDSPGIDDSSAPPGREDLDDDHPRVPVAAATSTRGYDRAPLRGGDTGPRLELHTVPPEDPAVYDMICAADTIGVFQIESRAQMTMLPRLRPRSFYDLVIEVAIVRPGPIQGNMVHPYLRRRNDEERIEYPSPEVEKVLKKTLGVPLFQEQAMSLAIVAAGFTPGEADQLRRAIAAWKSKPNSIMAFGEKLVGGMLARGYSPDFAHRCFEQIKGFSGYGFPESHAASFALLVYVSSWLKKYHPAAFAAALINSQPMGFYAPAQIVRDAAEHGAPVRTIDVNHSGWDCTLEDPPRCVSSPALRLGMRLVRGLNELEARNIEDAVKRRGPFPSLESLWRVTGVKVASLRRLAQADAFTSMTLDRQAALWHIRALRDERLPIFEIDNGKAAQRQSRKCEPTETTALPGSDLPLCRCADVPLSPALPPIPPPRQVVHDYAATGLSLKAHPISFMRPQLAARAVTPAADLRDGASWPTGQPIVVAGLVLVRQRPATASGIVFMTIEDETGIANLIIRPKIYEKYRKAARHSIVILARGHIERQREVIHVLVTSVEDIRDAGITLAPMSRDFH